ncbi:MAG: thioredoxin-disulfide reductase [Candidatus Omnitrophica bacterium]|nr:thioredoxin-disulfide reductase [Candidatus Omnitrophota bacterium]
MQNFYDLAIIGAGIAGVSSAVYAKRAGLKFVIFESGSVGGQLLLMERVDNFIGLGLNVSGYQLAEQLSKTLNDLGIQLIFEKVIKINTEEKIVKIWTEKNFYTSKALIISTGASFKKLKIKGEDEFIGKGVSYCAVCDGFFFKNKTVAVIGGGNTAAQEALYLSNICAKIFLIHRRDKLRALNYLQEALFKKENLKIIYNHIVTQINGKNFVEEIILEDTENKLKKNLNVDAIFIAIGATANTQIFKGIIDIDADGFILTDERLKTSLDFIWAAGDCRRRPLRQLITAAAEGSIAAIEAYKYLKTAYISI